MIKRIAAAIAALALGATMAVAVSSPAQAAKSSCPGGRICIWDGVDYSGSPSGSWTINTIWNQTGHCLQLTGANRATASSIYWNGTFLRPFYSFTLYSVNGNRGISTNGYSDANMLVAPGIASFSNQLHTICANQV